MRAKISDISYYELHIKNISWLIAANTIHARFFYFQYFLLKKIFSFVHFQFVNFAFICKFSFVTFE